MTFVEKVVKEIFPVLNSPRNEQKFPIIYILPLCGFGPMPDQLVPWKEAQGQKRRQRIGHF
jgi:hypothetical protein